MGNTVSESKNPSSVDDDGDEDGWLAKAHPGTPAAGDRVQVLWEVDKEDGSVAEEWYDASICQIKQASVQYPHQLIYSSDNTKEWVAFTKKVCKSKLFHERKIRWHRGVFKSAVDGHASPLAASQRRPARSAEEPELTAAPHATPPLQHEGIIRPTRSAPSSTPASGLGSPSYQVQVKPEETSPIVRESLNFVGALTEVLGEDPVYPPTMPQSVTTTYSRAAAISDSQAADITPGIGTGRKRKAEGISPSKPVHTTTGVTQVGEVDTAFPNQKHKERRVGTTIAKKLSPTPTNKRTSRGKGNESTTPATMSSMLEKSSSLGAAHGSILQKSRETTLHKAPTKDHAPASESKTDEDDVFFVERIVKSKKVKGKEVFFVKWLGYPESENTWEPYANVKGCEYLAEFRKANKIAGSSCL